MRYEFSLPTKADQVPTGPDWLHEVKYDGYRMMLIRERDRVGLISRGGHDRARHLPLIVEAALKLRQQHFVIDGEAVVLGPDGVSGFAALHSGGAALSLRHARRRRRGSLLAATLAAQGQP